MSQHSGSSRLANTCPVLLVHRFMLVKPIM